LSLHYLEAGEYQPAWRYATAAAKRAEGVYAYVEAAGLYARALEAGRHIEGMDRRDLATANRELGDSWYRAGEFQKASDAYVAARSLAANDPLMDAELLLKLSHAEDKCGKFEQALRWAEQARSAFQ